MRCSKCSTGAPCLRGSWPWSWPTACPDIYPRGNWPHGGRPAGTRPASPWARPSSDSAFTSTPWKARSASSPGATPLTTCVPTNGSGLRYQRLTRWRRGRSLCAGTCHVMGLRRPIILPSGPGSLLPRPPGPGASWRQSSSKSTSKGIRPGYSGATSLASSRPRSQRAPVSCRPTTPICR
jgi:hypothetical protein